MSEAAWQNNSSMPSDSGPIVNATSNTVKNTADKRVPESQWTRSRSVDHVLMSNSNPSRLQQNETHQRKSMDPTHLDTSRKSLSYAQRQEADAYYDSRAATITEWKRRARTLQEFYDNNPQLLPQLPFTWHHGWIIFAVVATIWGGPTYLEFAIRSLRLIKKERFYRPLGTDSRWCFDMLNWASVITITAVTALFTVGSAPHEVWLRVLSMPAPAILYCLGGVLAFITLFHAMDWPAPFRISSTAKGEKVLPGVYYFIEDVVAVNAGAGRPYREALAARYKASPRFQRMLYIQSLFWSIPALILAGALTVVAVLPAVPSTGYNGLTTIAGMWGYEKYRRSVLQKT
ncbi:hypothetical protein PT974_11852 [Cladobotryum mycophilum]|uniref:Uncharacterized protein n=1 Tax=Cladobotryum mycophilum TaxID=491253 RepID=A0ABR0S7H1_9HYPO